MLAILLLYIVLYWPSFLGLGYEVSETSLDACWFCIAQRKGSPPSIVRLAICLDGPPVDPSKQHRIHQQIESNEDLAQERRKCAWRLTPFGYRWWRCKKNTETVATGAFWNKMSIAVMFHSHALLPPNDKMSDLYKLAGLDCLDYEGKQKTSETQGISFRVFRIARKKLYSSKTKILRRYRSVLQTTSKQKHRL